MAVTMFSDMKVYNPQMQAGFVETITQNIDVINAASGGCIYMTTDRKPGHYDIEAFFQNTANLVTRRDITSVAAATPVKLAQSEFIDVKLNRKIGPLDATEDSLIKAGFAIDTAQFVGGVQAAKAVTQNLLHSALVAGVAHLAAQASLFLDISTETTKTITNDSLVRTISLMGDQAGRIRCWIMHSSVYFKLVGYQIAQNTLGVSDLVLATASPVALNRPIIVTDDPALVVVEGAGSTAVNEYLTLGLTERGIQIEDTEGERMYFDRITGLENILWRMQGEYAFNLGIKGAAWDVTNGGLNPTDTAIGTGSNWDFVMQSHKDGAGVLLRTR